MSENPMGFSSVSSSQQDPGSGLLLALCGEKDNLEIREVPLSADVQQDVFKAFRDQEEVFRKANEKPFDENWLNEGDEIVTAPIPGNILVFDEILSTTDTEIEPIKPNNFEQIRGLAIKIRDQVKQRILVQLFAKSQSLNRRGIVSLLFENNTYTRLESSTFCLADKLVCIVEDDLIKFRSLHNLNRVIDTSKIFSVATDNDVKSFAQTHANLFEISDINLFTNSTKRDARKYIKSLAKNSALLNHSVQTLKDAADKTQLKIKIQNGKIVMPSTNKEITELMRFLNDSRYFGPISRQTFITNSRRKAN